MEKQKIFVRDVLPGANDLDIVIAELDGKELQICLPKHYDMEKCIGEEIYFEARNGKYQISQIRLSKEKGKLSAQTQKIEDT